MRNQMQTQHTAICTIVLVLFVPCLIYAEHDVVGTGCRLLIKDGKQHTAPILKLSIPLCRN